jgi:uncharacterized protein (TIGR02246 family)
VKFIFALPLLALATELSAQASQRETAIRRIVDNETAAWNKGDATAYSRDFSADGSFTNIRGEFYSGYPAFLKRHEVIFATIFKNSDVKQEIVSLRFIRPDVAVVETLTSVGGIAQAPPGVALDAEKRLRTRLLQVIAKEKGTWKIVAYHNVDVKPGTALPGSK